VGYHRIHRPGVGQFCLPPLLFCRRPPTVRWLRFDGEPTSIVKAFAALRAAGCGMSVNTLAFLCLGSIILVVLVGGLAPCSRPAAQSLGQANAVAWVITARPVYWSVRIPSVPVANAQVSLAVRRVFEEKLGALRSLKRSVFLTRTRRAHPGASAHCDGCPGMIVSAFMIPVFGAYGEAHGKHSPGITPTTLAVSRAW